jgi:hypothetical protein
MAILLPVRSLAGDWTLWRVACQVASCKPHPRHITLGRTPLDEWSARRRDLYLTTHNTCNRQTSMTPAGFEPSVSASERQQTHALACAATGIGLSGIQWTQNTVRDSVLHRHCAIARNVRSSAVYENPNSAYERRIRGENLQSTKVQVVRRSEMRGRPVSCNLRRPTAGAEHLDWPATSLTGSKTGLERFSRCSNPVFHLRI